MRGGWRGRVERPQVGQASVQSYAEAVYPPRAYYFYEQIVDERDSAVATQVEAIVLPSIDADASCEPRMSARGDGVARETMIERRAPPRLRDYAPCFLPDASGIEGAVMAHCARYKEPLNVTHYPQLGCDMTVLRSLLPRELWSYAALSRGGSNTSSTVALRIRSVRRPHALHPVRRGAKVMLMAPRQESSTHGAVEATHKRPRSVLDAMMQGDVGGTDGVVKRMKVEKDEDDGMADGDGVEASEEEDDVASIDMQREDDDDNNDDLSDGGDDGDDGVGGYDDGGDW